MRKILLSTVSDQWRAERGWAKPSWIEESHHFKIAQQPGETSDLPRRYWPLDWPGTENAWVLA